MVKVDFLVVFGGSHDRTDVGEKEESASVGTGTETH